MSTYDLPVNKNGRVYLPNAMRKMVADSRSKIDAGRMFGQIESPADGKTRLARASHIVRKLRINARGEIIGTMEFLDTEAGRMAMEMIKRGAPIAGTMRGVGTVDENGVVSDVTLASIDVTMAAPEFEVPSAVDQMGDLVREDDDDD